MSTANKATSVQIKHMEFNHTHGCAYSFVNEHNHISDFGVITVPEDETTKNPTADAVRGVLKQTVQKDKDQFKIIDNQFDTPQLEIGRLPLEKREIARRKEYNILRQSPSHSYHGEKVVKETINFSKYLYGQTNTLISTDTCPMMNLRDKQQVHKFDVFTDGSVDRQVSKSARSFVIVGESGGLFGASKKVPTQPIDRCELDAIISALEYIVHRVPESDTASINFHTDSLHSTKALQNPDEFYLEKSLQDRFINLIEEYQVPFSINKIPREVNTLADVLAKTARHQKQKITIGTHLDAR